MGVLPPKVLFARPVKKRKTMFNNLIQRGKINSRKEQIWF